MIQRRAHHVVHGSVHDHEVFGLCRLEVLHGGKQDTGASHQRASRLKVNRQIGITAFSCLSRDSFHKCFGRGRCFIRVAHTQAAAEIKVIKHDAVLRECVYDVKNLVGGMHEGLKFGDLAADVHIDARNSNAGQFGGALIERNRLVVGDAELIVFETG